MTGSLDQVALKFSPQSLLVLNVALAFIVFSVSLFIERGDLRALAAQPRAALAGLTGQWLWLPGITLALILLLQPHPGIALGMLLVAACPGGNVSNFFCLTARANVVLSIGLTTVSTLGAAIITPLIFGIGSAVIARDGVPPVSVSFAAMLETLLWVIALPLALGTALRRLAEPLALRIRKPLRIASGLVLLAFIVVAFVNNIEALRAQLGAVFLLVAVHNALALAGGYGIGVALRLGEAERRTVALETGLQNSALALVLVFSFFGGNGPMALVAAWWGVWHLISGGLLSWWWSRRGGDAHDYGADKDPG